MIANPNCPNAISLSETVRRRSFRLLVLSSTNLIENLFSRVREIGRRVKRWQNGTMVLRWTAAGVLEAQRGFRKLVGYRAMPILVAALRAHDAQFNRAERRIDDTEKAA